MASWLLRILLSGGEGAERVKAGSHPGGGAGGQSFTFHRHVDPRGQKKAPEAVVEDLVALQRGCGVVGDFDP